MSIDQHDDEYHVPLLDQRVFGAGIKRKRIAFVPATLEQSSASSPSSSKARSVGDRYLSIVLKKDLLLQASTDKNTQADTNHEESSPTPSLCIVCGQPSLQADNDESQPHELTIAHQVCLEHSHPPSHLDRSHVGLKYLQDYGWNPDARTGLGARAEGIRIPIKAKEKNDSAGLGMGQDNEEADDMMKKRKKDKAKDASVRLNAKQVRKMEDDKTARAQKLRSDVYGPDLSQYLGGDD